MSNDNHNNPSDTELEWKFIYSEAGQIKELTLSGSALRTNEGVCVGRESGPNGLQLIHKSISRHHCRFFIDDKQCLYIEDLGSQNGTFLNGVKLVKNGAKLVTKTDRIRIAAIDINLIFPYLTPLESHDIADDLTTLVENNEQTIVGDVAVKQKYTETGEKGKHVVVHNLFIERLVTFGARKPWISLLLTTLITAVCLWGAQNIQIDTSYDSMFNPNDPSYPVYQKVIDEFGSDNITLIYFQHENLFTAENLNVIEEVTNALKDLDIVDNVESLHTTLSIRDSEEGLELGPLIDYPPESEAEVATIKENALYSPLLKHNQLSSDGNISSITVTLRPTLNEPAFNRNAYGVIDKAIQPLKKQFTNVFQIGAPRLNIEIEDNMFSDLLIMTPLTIGTLVVCILIMLRTTLAAILPLVTSGISIAWMFGFLGFSGIPLNFLTAILPGLVIVIGSTEDTHMLSAYLQGIDQDQQKQRMAAIRFMAIHVGLPIFITSFTTMIGFLSNSISDISLLRAFGYTSAFAMFANLVATILVLPMLLHFFGPRKTGVNSDMSQTTGWPARFVRVLEYVSEHHQKKIIVTVVLTSCIFGINALNVTSSNDPMSFFKAENEIVKNADLLHQNLAGMQVFFITVEAQNSFDFKDPSELQKLVKIEQLMDAQGVYDNVLSINDFLKLVNREMHQADPAFYRIPETRNLAEQYYMLFQRHDIERFISHDYKKANFVVRHNLSDSNEINNHLKTLQTQLQQAFGKNNKIYFSSKNLMVNKAAESLFISQIWSLGILVVIIFILMSTLYSSMTAGLVSLIPNIIPIVMMFGIMGMIGIPLNPGTAIVAVIAIGIAIDDTIHILSTYNRECRIDGDQAAAAKRSIRAEAIPVISTSIALAAGFLMLYFSRFHILTQFGLLSALTMIGAMLTDLLITPILFKRFRLVSLWDVIALNIGKEVLTKSEIFANMSSFQIKQAILMSQVIEYESATVIVEQNAIRNELFIIISGEIEMVHHDGQHKKLIDRLGAGEIFGESGYVGVASATTIRVPKAGQPLKVVILNPQKVDSAMRFYPRLQSKLNHNINTILAQRLLETGKLVQHQV